MSIIAQALELQEGVVCARVALESQGIKDQEEQEITIYAKIGNMEGLSQAALIEPQEQAEIKTPTGRIRVRKISLNGRQPTYELTTKRPIAIGAIRKDRERTKKINEDIYSMFMDVAPSFMSKTRYVFKTEQLRIKRGDMEAVIQTSDLAFEVDVFTKADGSISPWCKIDIETQKIAEILEKNNIGVENIKLIASISRLPFAPDHIVIDNKAVDDPDRKALIRMLYEKEFLIKKQ
jgi:hypothetical protein